MHYKSLMGSSVSVRKISLILEQSTNKNAQEHIRITGHHVRARGQCDSDPPPKVLSPMNEHKALAKRNQQHQETRVEAAAEETFESENSGQAQ